MTRISFPAVATWIAGPIGVILHAIGSLIIATGQLLCAAVKASAAWMKTVGTTLITSIKAGVGPKLKWMATNQITAGAGAATNPAWSGIQTARHGGSASDIWKSVARGAVIGAVSAVIGMGMHKMGTARGSIAQRGNSVTGTLVHAATNGGSFKDGFIGGAIGFGVGLPFGGAGGMIQGTDLGSIAAIGVGIASKLSGGSFADGEYSAAFFHLFNSELRKITKILNDSQMAKKLGLPRYALTLDKVDGAGGLGALAIADHGWEGGMTFGVGELDPRGETWTRITRGLPSSVRSITMYAGHVGSGIKGSSLLMDFSQYSQRQGIPVIGFTGQMDYSQVQFRGEPVAMRYPWNR